MNGRAWNSTLRPGRPLGRRTGLARTAGLSTRTPLRAVSDKRAAENRVRAAMVAAMFPERPLCVVYALSQHHPGLIPAKVLDGCGRWADDVHEPLSRARGGSITDPGNATPPCRPCHTAITPGPDWAYRLGLVKHSWPEGGSGGEAA